MKDYFQNADAITCLNLKTKYYDLFVFYFTASLAILSYFMRSIALSHIIVFIYVGLMTGLAIYLWPLAGLTLNEYFFSDRLGLIFYLILILVSLLSAIHYVKFVQDRNVKIKDVALHNSGTIFFTGAIIGVLFTSHFGILWAFMEATTLGASVLIYHNRNQDALEATWKYLYVCSIGIAIAFAGVLFLGFGTANRAYRFFFLQQLRPKPMISTRYG